MRQKKRQIGISGLPILQRRMKKIRIVTSMFLGLSMLAAPVFAGTYLDDFSDGVDAGWLPLIGEWKADEKVYKQLSAGDLWQRAMLKTIDGLDYKVSDFEVGVTAQLPKGNIGWLGLVFLHGEINEKAPGYEMFEALKKAEELGFQSVAVMPSGEAKHSLGELPTLSFYEANEAQRRRIKETISKFNVSSG